MGDSFQVCWSNQEIDAYWDFHVKLLDLDHNAKLEDERWINNTNLDVSVKCRTGVDNEDSYEFLKTFIGKISDAGCKTFFIHARKAILKGLSPSQNRTIPKLEYEKVYKLKKDFQEKNRCKVLN